MSAWIFQKTEQYSLQAESMPVLPSVNWTTVEDGISATLLEHSVPILYGQPGLLKIVHTGI